MAWISTSTVRRRRAARAGIGDGRPETGFGNLAVLPDHLAIDRDVPTCFGDDPGLDVAEHGRQRRMGVATSGVRGDLDLLRYSAGLLAAGTTDNRTRKRMTGRAIARLLRSPVLVVSKFVSMNARSRHPAHRYSSRGRPRGLT